MFKYKRWILIIILLSLQSVLADDLPYFDENAPMPVGAYYYPEHWPEEQWERDLKKMSELGFEFTHFGEFAWARMEPEEGKYDFEWLDKCVALADKYGLKVIMCTPTPCPPAWLSHKHPEILVVNDKGVTMRHGSRLHASWSSPLYLNYVEKIVTELGKRYGNDERIWGWQLDNEPSHGSAHYDYSKASTIAFRDWLKTKYKTIDHLNFAWGNAFWSQTYNDFEQIRIPNQNEMTAGVNPHALLDFQRFTSEELGNYLRFQALILRKYIKKDQFVTTNYAYFGFLPEIDLWENWEDLDFASNTMYLLSTYLDAQKGPLSHRLGSGLNFAFTNDFTRSVKGEYGTMELQPGQINWGQYNSLPLPGAVNMWLWHGFSQNARFICAYRFRQPLYGGEQYHKGIMQPDGVSVSRGGKEYVQFIKQLEQLRDEFDPDAEMPKEYLDRKITFLWNKDNLFDLQNHPETNQWNTWQHVYRYFDAAKRCAAPVEFITEKHDFDPVEYPILIAPAYQLIDKELVSRWEQYARNGGQLILTTRTGTKDRNGHLWEEKWAGSISDLIGAEILYFDNLPDHIQGSILFNHKCYNWNTWGDVLNLKTVKVGLETPQVLAVYTTGFYKRKPAIITRRLGKGTVTFIGVDSDDGEIELEVLKTIYNRSNITCHAQPSYVYTHWRDGWYITCNYMSAPYELSLSLDSKILLGDKKLMPGSVSIWRE